MAHHPSHARRLRRHLVDWWHGPHRTTRHPTLTVYTLGTAAAMGYIAQLLAPLAR